MADTTGISWTDHTFNPWRGCVAVSPACDHCYAETQTRRYGLDLWGKDAERRRTSESYWRKPLAWDRQAKADGQPHLVFCGSLCDVFEPRPDLDLIRRDLWPLIESTPHLRWQLLTKRPEQVPHLVPREWMMPGGWPAHVWIGTTVEDQAAARLRIPRLLDVPAPVRFLSMEPLLGPVELMLGVDHRGLGHEPDRITGAPWSQCLECSTDDETVDYLHTDHGIGWVIVGGESGPRHRPLDLDHARDVRDQCAVARVPFLFKQVGGARPTSGGHLLDGRAHHEFPPEAGDRSDGGPLAAQPVALARTTRSTGGQP